MLLPSLPHFPYTTLPAYVTADKGLNMDARRRRVKFEQSTSR